MNEPPFKNGAFIAKLGAWLQLGMVFGLAGMVSGMRKAFREIGLHTTHGTSDSSIMSAPIGELLWTTVAGLANSLVAILPYLALSLVGILLVTIAITVCRYRAVWMFWFLSLYGGLLIFSPFLPFGLFLLIYGLMKKDEFLRPASSLLPDRF